MTNSKDSSQFHESLHQASSIEAEQCVLGACLLDNTAFASINDVLKMEDFYLPKHQRIYKAMAELYNAGKPIEIIALHEQMRAIDGTGDPSYLVELTHQVTGSSEVVRHAQYVRQKAISRGIITSGHEMVRRAGDPTENIHTLLDEYRGRLDELSDVIQPRRTRAVSVGVAETDTVIGQMRSGERKTFGVSTGYRMLDTHFGGLEGGQLIVMAGRPGMGKTALALSMTRNITEHDPADLFSLEMPEREVVLRLLSAEAAIPYYYLKMGRYGATQEESYRRAVTRISSLQLHINDQAAVSLNDVRNKMRVAIRERGAKGFFIDYLGLMRMERAATRDLEIGIVTRGLKETCKEFGVWVVLLAQLNRGVEYRADKRPMLSDLRESGNIEQDADIVLFVHRPEMFGIKTLEDGRSSAGMAEVIIAKNRNGATGIAEMVFRKDFMRFETASEPTLAPSGPSRSDEAGDVIF